MGELLPGVSSSRGVMQLPGAKGEGADDEHCKGSKQHACQIPDTRLLLCHLSNCQIGSNRINATGKC